MTDDPEERDESSRLPQAVSTKEKESYRMSAIQNLHSFDPFADARIADDYDKKKLVKTFKKKFACNGTVIEHPEYGEVIQLQGDQRKNICQFLIETGLAKDNQLKERERECEVWPDLPGFYPDWPTSISALDLTKA
ncbi:hypothetical protein STEG23_036128 [Scotinomys teguina]